MSEGTKLDVLDVPSASWNEAFVQADERGAIVVGSEVLVFHDSGELRSTGTGPARD